MRAPIRFDRASLGAAVLVALALAGCSQDLADGITTACVLGEVDGDLVRAGDAPVLLNARWNGPIGERLALRLPAGWSVRETDGGELEIVDAGGAPAARTGTRVLVGAAINGTEIRPWVIDGTLVVCPSGPIVPE